jgi:hypothetical protein
MRKRGRFIRRAERRLAERTKPFEGQGKAAQVLRERLASGAMKMPGSLKGHL